MLAPAFFTRYTMQAELLSPCGSLESLRAALRFGADAVYMGGPVLQMRSASAGFDLEKLASAIALVHKQGKKAYITVNTLLKNSETGLLRDYGQALLAMGADGAIVSDLGALRILGREVPGLPLHISTQCSVMNHEAAMVYYDMGARRLVLAREMTLEDIGEMHARLPQDLELEAFVHGAMCMAYSGRCLISSFILDRSGNRGQCAQPCRWEYAEHKKLEVEERKRPGQVFTIEEEKNYSMVLSSRDLCMVEHLQALHDAGVVSFKIEGRMKSDYYCAAVTNAYRMAMEGADLSLCRRELDMVSHRPYTTGFYYGELPDGHFNSGLYEQDWTFCATVESWEEGVATLIQRNHVALGDELYPLTPGQVGLHFPLTAMEDEEGQPLTAAPHPLMRFRIPCPLPLRPGDFIRRPSR